MIEEIIINPTPKVEVVRIKKGIPTVINYGGNDYILRPKGHYRTTKGARENERG